MKHYRRRLEDKIFCPLCQRNIPPNQRDKHHLIPKLKGGKEIIFLHRICHRYLHAIFSESELAKKYSNIESLMQHEEIKKFVSWVKTKPDEYLDGVKLSKRRR